MNITIIQVYAILSNYDDNVIEELYETIEDAIAKTPNKYFLLVNLLLVNFQQDLSIKEEIDF